MAAPILTDQTPTSAKANPPSRWLEDTPTLALHVGARPADRARVAEMLAALPDALVVFDEGDSWFEWGERFPASDAPGDGYHIVAAFPVGADTLALARAVLDSPEAPALLLPMPETPDHVCSVVVATSHADWSVGPDGSGPVLGWYAAA